MELANSNPPMRTFSVAMLFNDKRYRSRTIQLVVLLAFTGFVLWVVHNTMLNLSAKDKDISFSFLLSRAGYDIDQHLIPYSNDSTHGRAAVVGLLNTVLVGLLGCGLATIIGIFVGVLRLSGNWLASKFAAAYVEILRNIPIVLWIILLFAILSESTPSPRDFKVVDGQTPNAAMILDVVAVTNRGVSFPWPSLSRPLGTINLIGLSFDVTPLILIAVIAGSAFLNRQILKRARRRQEKTGIRPRTWWKSVLILVAPTLFLLLALGLHFDFPSLRGFNFTGGLTVSHSFTALWLAISLYTSSYIAEVVRAGIQAISRGQAEAAYALGFHRGRTMRLIILPQALRIFIPPLTNQYLSLVKNTTLGAFISYLDLRGTLGGITLNQTGRELECMLLLMFTYLILSLSIASVMNLINAKVAIKER